jgi:hypothetical protein
VPGWQKRLIGGVIGGLGGWSAITLLGFIGWWSLVLYLIIAPVVMTLAMMLFCKFIATPKETPWT